jgi:hypothetical protein
MQSLTPRSLQGGMRGARSRPRMAAKIKANRRWTSRRARLWRASCRFTQLGIVERCLVSSVVRLSRTMEDKCEADLSLWPL